MSIDYERLFAKKFKFEIGKTYTEESVAPYMRADIDNRMSYCFELLADGKEEDASYIIEFCIGNDHTYGWLYSSQGCLAQAVDKFKDKAILYRLIRGVYINDGYHFPRRLILKMKSASSAVSENERLGDLDAVDPIVVYRASSTSDGKTVCNEISWTTNYDTAVFFAYRMSLQAAEWRKYDIEPLHIWKAEIQRKQIIAYCNDRNEYEVIQHHGVKKVVMLPEPSDSEVTRVFREREQRYK